VPARRGSTLFVDADDTLWENNIYFDAVVAQYVALVGRHGCPPERATARLLEIERARTREFGYGVLNFQASLEAAIDGLVGERDWSREAATIRELCTGLRRQAITHLAGVDETLRELGSRHRLILVTKGDHDDQLAKVARSGLRTRLHQIDVLVEKDAAAYRDLVRRHGVDPARAWMVGNSPKSDILPALEAGLRTVFIPHAATWTLELVDMPAPPPDRVLVLDQFADLTLHF
jgi:putative hydrolase of the HAD superfamily